MKKLQKLSCDKRKDKISRRIRDLTAKEFVDWLIKYHGLPIQARDNVILNLQQQYDFHRIQGRLENNKALADGLDAFWNAAIGAVRQDNYSSSQTLETIGAMAQGFAAVAAELRKGGAA